MKMAKFRYWKSTKDGLFYWNVINIKNGKILADGGEGYANRVDLAMVIAYVLSEFVERSDASEIPDPDA